MAIKPTLFVVTDIETTMRKRIAFDIAWRIVDRRGEVYGSGSYVIREAFKHDLPFFAEKMGHYFDDAYTHQIQPASILEVQEEYNRQVATLQEQGHRVILCAYNARFDFTHLPRTLQVLTDDSNARWMNCKAPLLDIWDFWGQSVPLAYRANPSASGKFYSTSAESAYRWEFDQADFEERHIAWHDCLIESDILLKAIRRKKQMPLVNRPTDFAADVWRKINSRLGVDGKEVIAA